MFVLEAPLCISLLLQRSLSLPFLLPVWLETTAFLLIVHKPKAETLAMLIEEARLLCLLHG